MTMFRCLLLLTTASAFTVLPTTRRMPVMAASVAEERAVDLDEEDFGSWELAPVDALENLPEEDDEDDEAPVREFMQLIQETPVGQLEPEDLELMPDVLSTLCLDGQPEQASQLLERWASEDSKLNLSYFSQVYEAWQAEDLSRQTNLLPQAVDSVWRLWSLQSSRPDQDTLTRVLNILSTSRDRGIDRRIWSVWEKRGDVTPTEAMYASVVTSLAKSRESGAAARAEKVVRQAAKDIPPHRDENGELRGIPAETFNAVLVSWAKSGEGVERAEKLIEFMDALDRDNGELGVSRPNISSFTCLIDAYAQENEWPSVVRAEGILQNLVNEYLDGREYLKPNVVTWTVVISAFARLSKKGSFDAASRAHKLLRQMEQLTAEGHEGFAPDSIVYVTVMNACAFSKSANGPQKAAEILDEMYERYMDGEESMKPSMTSIRILIDSYTKREEDGDAMDNAEATLDRYEDFLETAASEDPAHLEDIQEIYGTMLFGWTKAGDPERAEDYLNELMDRDMEITPFHFDRVIECNAMSVDPEAFARSERIFERLEECRQQGRIEPNERVYTSFIRALFRAKVPNSARRSQELLQRMEELYAMGNPHMKPTVFSYNAAILACSVSASEDAFPLALQTFQAARKLGPDHVTFANMMRCACLLDDEEDKKTAFLTQLWQLCCKQGLVNRFVLRDFQGQASDELREKLLGTTQHLEDVDGLPAEWSRTEKQAKKKPMRSNDRGGPRKKSNRGPRR